MPVTGSGVACVGATDHVLGLATATVGALAGAVTHLRSGIARHDALGARAWAVRRRPAQAGTLRSAGEADRARGLPRDATAPGEPAPTGLAD